MNYNNLLNNESIILYELRRIKYLRSIHIYCNCFHCMKFVKCLRCNNFGHFTENCIIELCTICYTLGHNNINCKRLYRCSKCGRYGHDILNCIYCPHCNLVNHTDEICNNQCYQCYLCGKINSKMYHCHCTYYDQIKWDNFLYLDELNIRYMYCQKWLNNFKNRLLKYKLYSDINTKDMENDILNKTLEMKKKLHKELLNLNWINIFDKKKVNYFIMYFNNSIISNKTSQNIELKDKIQKYRKKIESYTESLQICENTISNNINEINSSTSYCQKFISQFEKENTFTCNICWSEINNFKICVTKCGHIYCSQCIININKKCPLCRTLLKIDKDIIIINNSENMISHNIGNYNVLC